MRRYSACCAVTHGKVGLLGPQVFVCQRVKIEPLQGLQWNLIWDLIKCVETFPAWVKIGHSAGFNTGKMSAGWLVVTVLSNSALLTVGPARRMYLDVTVLRRRVGEVRVVVGRAPAC
jgi:hypothetical protein